MAWKSIILLSSGFLLFACCDESLEYRTDYTFNEEVNAWLKLHTLPSTWSDARLMCYAEGAVLASPLTYELQDAIVKHVAEQNDLIHTIFIGVHTTYAKGVYASIEGVSLSRLRINWAPGQPDNIANSESCLAMQTSSNASISDVKCTEIFPYVCYKNKTQSLVINNECGTYDSEYKIDARTGMCYKFHRRGLIWSAAYKTCMAEGGHLVVINSNVEAQVIKELFGRQPDNGIFAQWPFYAWVGMYDARDGGYWMTIHGEAPTEAGFDIWQTGEPNNDTQPGGEFCGLIHRTHTFLHDGPCEWIVPFICEIDPTLDMLDKNFPFL